MIISPFGSFFLGITPSKLDFWHGDGSWAARYHVTSVHLLLIPLIALLILQMSSVTGLKRWLISSLIALAILVQIPSLVFDPSVNSGAVLFAEPKSFLRFRLAERIDSVKCLIGFPQAQNCLNEGTYNRSNLRARVYFWPLKSNRAQGLLWRIWGLLAITAFISTLVLLIDWRIFL